MCSEGEAGALECVQDLLDGANPEAIGSETLHRLGIPQPDNGFTGALQRIGQLAEGPPEVGNEVDGVRGDDAVKRPRIERQIRYRRSMKLESACGYLIAKPMSRAAEHLRRDLHPVDLPAGIDAIEQKGDPDSAPEADVGNDAFRRDR